jgi:Fe-S-cluster containining protein
MTPFLSPRSIILESNPMSDKPFADSPVVPVQLEPDHEFNFRCYPGVSCFNACCRAIDITLTPYDVVRLRRRLGMSSSDFLKAHTAPFQMDQDGLPGIKLRTEDEQPTCLFMVDEGCSIYEDRPTACRYYPVAQLSIRNADEYVDRESFAMVREDHCKGHEEPRPIKVAEYRAEQGLDDYDRHNRGWRQLVLKKKSLGPAVGKPSKRSLQLFFMANYDLDAFRIFTLQEGFRKGFALSEEEWQQIDQSDEALLDFSYRLMRQVLFGEESLMRSEGAVEERVASKREREAARADSDEVYDATFDDSGCA